MYSSIWCCVVVVEGRAAARRRACKYTEMSASLGHNVDQLLAVAVGFHCDVISCHRAQRGMLRGQRRSATTSTSCWWAYCSRSASRAAVTPPYTTPRLPPGRLRRRSWPGAAATPAAWWTVAGPSRRLAARPCATGVSSSRRDIASSLQRPLRRCWSQGRARACSLDWSVLAMPSWPRPRTRT